MAQKKGPGPAGDGTRGVLASPTIADQLAAEKAARDRQDFMGWEPVKKAKKRVNASGPEGATVKKLSGAQAKDLARRLRAKLSRKPE